MTGLRLTRDQDALAVSHGEQQLLRYVYRPTEAQLESPRPYFHPLRTLTGDCVSLYRPHDHVWHKGIAWSLPNVGPENFWAAPPTCVTAAMSSSPTTAPPATGSSPTCGATTTGLRWWSCSTG